jgi:hypothetical protein
MRWRARGGGGAVARCHRRYVAVFIAIIAGEKTAPLPAMILDAVI